MSSGCFTVVCSCRLRIAIGIHVCAASSSGHECTYTYVSEFPICMFHGSTRYSLQLGSQRIWILKLALHAWPAPGVQPVTMRLYAHHVWNHIIPYYTFVSSIHCYHPFIALRHIFLIHALLIHVRMHPFALLHCVHALLHALPPCLGVFAARRAETRTYSSRARGATTGSATAGREPGTKPTLLTPHTHSATSSQKTYAVS
jgi:hypothetical protein